MSGVDAARNYSTCVRCRTRYHQWEIDSWRFPQCPGCGGVVFVPDARRMALRAFFVGLLVMFSLLLPTGASAASCSWSISSDVPTYNAAAFATPNPFTGDYADPAALCSAVGTASGWYGVFTGAGGSLASATCAFTWSGQPVVWTLASPGCDGEEEEEEDPDDEVGSWPLQHVLVLVGAFLAFAIGFGSLR